MKSDESIALAKIAKILLRKNISKIFLTDNRVLYLSNRYLEEFSLIVEDYTSFYYTVETCPSITIYSDGSIMIDMFHSNEEALLRMAKIMYNVVVDNLKLKYFWKEIKR